MKLQMCEIVSLMLFAAVPAIGMAGLRAASPGPVLMVAATAEGVTLEQVVKWPEVQWVDARSAKAFVRGHVPGAVHLSLDFSPPQWDAALVQLLENLDPAAAIVVYCDGGSCHASHHVAARLRSDAGGKISDTTDYGDISDVPFSAFRDVRSDGMDDSTTDPEGLEPGD